MCLKLLSPPEVTLCDTISFAGLFVTLYGIGILIILEDIGMI